MRTETRYVEVPAHTEEKVFYIASDNAAFNSESACKKHEIALERENNPVWQNRIENVYDFSGNYRTTLFFISSQEDYDFLVRTMEVHNLDEYSDGFETNGRGWYMHWWSGNGSLYGTDYIQKLDNYIASVSKEWDEWRMDVTMKINDKVFGKRCEIE